MKTKFVEERFLHTLEVIERFSLAYKIHLEQFISVILDQCKKGGKLILLGNGGSAADCTHIANEWIMKYRTYRRPLPAIALSSNTALISAAANDGLYDEVFSRQIQVLGQRNDIVIGLSTSGKSINVENALKEAAKLKIVTAAFTGPKSHSNLCFVDHHFSVEDDDPGKIQELHLMCLHIITDMIERDFI